MGQRIIFWTLTIALVIVLIGLGVYAVTRDGNTEVAGTCMVDETKRMALNAAAVGEVAAFQANDRGGSLQDLAFADSDGASVSFADFAGKTVLFNLWATWCVPCRVEMPALDELQAELGGDNFQVVPVSVDLGSDDKPKAFYAETGLQHLPFYHDGEIATLDVLKKAGIAYGLPATVIADDEGCILGWLNGPAEWASPDAKALVGAAMRDI